MISAWDIVLVTGAAAITASLLIWLDAWLEARALRPKYLTQDQARRIVVAARSINLSETEQVVVRAAMQQLRSSNILLDTIATETDLSMNACAQAAREVITKINGNTTRSLVERATRR